MFAERDPRPLSFEAGLSLQGSILRHCGFYGRRGGGPLANHVVLARLMHRTRMIGPSLCISCQHQRFRVRHTTWYLREDTKRSCSSYL
jgi:hypothetical protein